MKLRPGASTRATTCPGPGEGSGPCAGRRTSGPPKPSIRMAFMEYPRAGARIAYDESCYAREGEEGVRKLSRREKGLLGLLAVGGGGLSAGAARPPDAPAGAPPVGGPTPGGAAAGATGGAPGDAVASGPVTPSLPPLNLKYIGSVESKAGVKVAVLLTDRKEILTRQTRQVGAHR